MIRGLYTGASGMKTQQEQMNNIANNLSNLNTTSYKRDTTVFKAFPEMLLRRMNDDEIYKYPMGSVDQGNIIGKLGTGVETNEVYTQFEQGGIQHTEDHFDFALEGRGFFTIETPRGIAYTRNGTFMIDKNNYLVTKEGDYVLGEKGRIQVQTNNFEVNEDGAIMVNADLYQPGERVVENRENNWNGAMVIDRFRIADFRELRGLRKQGNSLYSATKLSGSERTARVRPKVLQGMLETSNVNPVTEMTRMIEVNRMYEASSKTIQAHDRALEQLINSVARV